MKARANCFQLYNSQFDSNIPAGRQCGRVHASQPDGGLRAADVRAGPLPDGVHGVRGHRRAGRPELQQVRAHAEEF